MATTRIKLDGRGKGILDLFAANMGQLGELNKLVDTGAGVAAYKGPDANNPVHITQPRQASYDSLTRAPSPYESYWVREITFPAGWDGLAITQDENETSHDESFVEASKDIFQGKSSTNLLKEYGAYGTKRGAADPHSFMRLKGRKGLFTLLGETMDAFFDSSGKPVYRESGRSAGESSLSNRYFAGEKSYDYKFLDRQGDSFVDEPSNEDIQEQALAGFALGQLLGGADQTTVIDEIRAEASDATVGYFTDLINSTEDDSLKEFYINLLSQTIGTAGGDVTRISQLYVPGWVRPNENYLTKKPLTENLNQNLLLPPSSTSLSVTNPLNMPGNTNGNGEGLPGHGDTRATFQSLYTRNRAGTEGGINVANPLFNNGAIAGTAINLLQEPTGVRTTGIITGEDSVPPSSRVPFTFEQDDAKYLTYDKRVAGFTSNGPNVGTQPAKMEPAVKQGDTLAGDDGSIAEIDKETIAMSQGQYFPFVFSTINKKDDQWQTCFLQATLNSLSESYNPTWQSKHFFGRSEQVHTYTFTDRNIDLSFTIFANEMRQLQNVYERVLWLAQQCYPDFDNTGRMSQGPIIAVRVGDLFQFKRGIIRSLNYDWFGVGGGKWEMTSGMRMPQGCTVTMSYQIIHNDIPSRDFDFYGGPAGGLNAATKRSRILGGDNSDGIFGEFKDDLDVGSVNYDNAHRLIDAGNVDATYLNTVDANNYTGMEWSGGTAGGTANIMNVPVGLEEGDDDGDLIPTFSETYDEA